MGNIHETALCNENIAVCYINMKQVDEALSYFIESMGNLYTLRFYGRPKCCPIQHW